MKKFDLEAEKQFSSKDVPSNFRVTPAGEVDSFFTLITGKRDWPILLHNKKILEVGAGECSFLPHILEVSRPQRYVATDLFPESMEFAKKNISSSIVEFRESNILDLPFDPEEFEVILAFGILHHIPNVNDALAEIARTLRPGGLFIFRDPWRGNPLLWLKFRWGHRSPNEFPLSTKLLKQALSTNSFRLIFLNRFWLRYPWLPPGPWSVNVGGMATKLNNFHEK